MERHTSSTVTRFVVASHDYITRFDSVKEIESALRKKLQEAEVQDRDLHNVEAAMSKNQRGGISNDDLKHQHARRLSARRSLEATIAAENNKYRKARQGLKKHYNVFKALALRVHAEVVEQSSSTHPRDVLTPLETGSYIQSSMGSPSQDLSGFFMDSYDSNHRQTYFSDDDEPSHGVANQENAIAILQQRIEELSVENKSLQQQVTQKAREISSMSSEIHSLSARKPESPARPDPRVDAWVQRCEEAIAQMQRVKRTLAEAVGDAMPSVELEELSERMFQPKVVPFDDDAHNSVLGVVEDEVEDFHSLARLTVKALGHNTITTTTTTNDPKADLGLNQHIQDLQDVINRQIAEISERDEEICDLRRQLGVAEASLALHDAVYEPTPEVGDGVDALQQAVYSLLASEAPNTSSDPEDVKHAGHATQSGIGALNFNSRAGVGSAVDGVGFSQSSGTYKSNATFSPDHEAPTAGARIMKQSPSPALDLENNKAILALKESIDGFAVKVKSAADPPTDGNVFLEDLKRSAEVAQAKLGRVAAELAHSQATVLQLRRQLHGNTATKPSVVAPSVMSAVTAASPLPEAGCVSAGGKGASLPSKPLGVGSGTRPSATTPTAGSAVSQRSASSPQPNTDALRTPLSRAAIDDGVALLEAHLTDNVRQLDQLLCDAKKHASEGGKEAELRSQLSEAKQMLASLHSLATSARPTGVDKSLVSEATTTTPEDLSALRLQLQQARNRAAHLEESEKALRQSLSETQKVEVEQLRSELENSKESARQAMAEVTELKLKAERDASRPSPEPEQRQTDGHTVVVNDELTKARAALNDTKEALEQEKAHSTWYKSEIEKLKSTNTSLQDSLEDRNGDRSGLAKKLAQAEAEAAQLRARVGELEQQLRDHHAIASSEGDLRAEVAELKNRLTAADASTTAALRKVKATLGSEAAVRQRLDDVVEQLAQQKKLVAKQAAATAAAEADTRTAKAARDTALADVDSAQRDIENAKSDRATALAAKKEADEKLKTAIASNNDLSRQLETVKVVTGDDGSASRAAVGNLNKQLAAAELEIRQLQSKVEAAGVTTESLRKQVDEGEKRAETSESLYKQVQHDLSLAKRNVQQLQERLAVSEASVESLEHSRTSLREKVARLEQGEHELESRVAELQSSNNYAKEDVGRKQEAIALLTQQLKAAEAAGAETRLSLQKAVDKNNSLKDELTDTHATIKKLQDTIDTLKHELHAHSSAAVGVSELKEQLSTSEARLLSAQKQIATLTRQLQAANAATVAAKEEAAEQIEVARRHVAAAEAIAFKRQEESTTETATSVKKLAEHNTQQLMFLEEQLLSVSKERDSALSSLHKARLDMQEAVQESQWLGKKAARLEKVEEENKRIQHELHLLQEHLSARETELQVKVTRLQAELQQCQAEAQASSADVKTLSAKLAASVARAKDLEHKSERVSGLEDDLRCERALSELAHSELAAAQNKVSELQQELARANKDLRGALAKAQSAEATQADLSAKAEEAQNRLSEKCEQVANLRRQNDVLQRELQTTASSIQYHEAEAQKYSRVSAELTEAMRAAAAEHEKADEQLRRKLDDAIAETHRQTLVAEHAQQELSAHQLLVKRTQHELASLRARAEQAEADAGQARADRKEVTAALDGRQQQLASLERDLARITSASAHSTEEVRRLENQVRATEETSAHFRALLDRKVATIRSLEENLRSAEETASAAAEEVAGLRREHSTAQNAVERARKETQAQQQRAAQAEAKLQSFEAQLAQLEAEAEAGSATQVSSLAVRLKAAQAETQAVRQELKLSHEDGQRQVVDLAEARADVLALQQKLAAAQGENAALTRQIRQLTLVQATPSPPPRTSAEKSWQERCRSAEETATALQQALEKKSALVDHLQAQLAEEPPHDTTHERSADNDASHLTEALAEQAHTIASQAVQIQQLSSEVSDLESANKSLKQQLKSALAMLPSAAPAGSGAQAGQTSASGKGAPGGLVRSAGVGSEVPSRASSKAAGWRSSENLGTRVPAKPKPVSLMHETEQELARVKQELARLKEESALQQHQRRQADQEAYERALDAASSSAFAAAIAEKALAAEKQATTTLTQQLALTEEQVAAQAKNLSLLNDSVLTLKKSKEALQNDLLVEKSDLKQLRLQVENFLGVLTATVATLCQQLTDSGEVHSSKMLADELAALKAQLLAPVALYKPTGAGTLGTTAGGGIVADAVSSGDGATPAGSGVSAAITDDVVGNKLTGMMVFQAGRGDHTMDSSPLTSPSSSLYSDDESDNERDNNDHHHNHFDNHTTPARHHHHPNNNNNNNNNNNSNNNNNNNNSNNSNNHNNNNRDHYGNETTPNHHHHTLYEHHTTPPTHPSLPHSTSLSSPSSPPSSLPSASLPRASLPQVSPLTQPSASLPRASLPQVSPLSQPSASLPQLRLNGHGGVGPEGSTPKHDAVASEIALRRSLVELGVAEDSPNSDAGPQPFAFSAEPSPQPRRTPTTAAANTTNTASNTAAPSSDTLAWVYDLVAELGPDSPTSGPDWPSGPDAVTNDWPSGPDPVARGPDPVDSDWPSGPDTVTSDRPSGPDPVTGDPTRPSGPNTVTNGRPSGPDPVTGGPQQQQHQYYNEDAEAHKQQQEHTARSPPVAHSSSPSPTPPVTPTSNVIDQPPINEGEGDMMASLGMATPSSELSRHPSEQSLASPNPKPTPEAPAVSLRRFSRELMRSEAGKQSSGAVTSYSVFNRLAAGHYDRATTASISRLQKPARVRDISPQRPSPQSKTLVTKPKMSRQPPSPTVPIKYVTSSPPEEAPHPTGCKCAKCDARRRLAATKLLAQAGRQSTTPPTSTTRSRSRSRTSEKHEKGCDCLRCQQHNLRFAEVDRQARVSPGPRTRGGDNGPYSSVHAYALSSRSRSPSPSPTPSRSELDYPRRPTPPKRSPSSLCATCECYTCVCHVVERGPR